MSTTNEKYREDLTTYLLEVATGNILKEHKHSSRHLAQPPGLQV